MKFTIDKAAILIATAALAWAAPTAAGQEAAAQDAAVCRGALQIVEDDVRNWKEGDGSELLEDLEKKGASVIDGWAQIYVHPNHGDWGKARSLAYTRAYLDAMDAFVRKTGQEIRLQRISDLVRDDDTTIVFDADEDPVTLLERIDRKEAVLVEMKLDQELKAAGMSDEELARLSGREKISRLLGMTEGETLTGAFGRAAGLVPLQTFEAVDDCDEGNSWIAVVAARSAETGQLAEDIDKGTRIRPDPPDPDRPPLLDRIAALSDEDLAKEFGVRVGPDQDGYPVIVAFGQWGWSPTAPTAAERDRRYAFARDQAETLATSYLAEFIHVNAQFTRENATREIIKRAVAVDDGFYTDGRPTSEITARIVDRARTESTVQLTGLGILRTWSSQHPVVKHQELTGAVAYWSPAREDQVRATLGLDAKHIEPEPEPEATPEPEPEPQPTASGTVQSKDLMDASDF